jgi:TolB protein
MNDARELRLFGRDGRVDSLVFEGKAAANLQQHTTPSDGADFDPDIDPTGKLMAYASTRHSQYSHLYEKAIHGATMTQVTDGASNDAQPRYSPDGRRIAFTSDRAGHWDVWVVDRDGRNPVQITHDDMPELHPSWSPDGRRLVYCRLNARENRGELWIVELDNPGTRRYIGEGLFPAWSPDGSKIAYQRARSRGSRWFSLWTLHIDRDEVLFPTEVAARNDAALIAPAWSADGQQLVYVIIESAEPRGGGTPDSRPLIRSDIGVVDSDGRGMQRITDGRGGHFAPTWSSDGRVYYSMKTPDGETLWSIKPFRPSVFDEPPSATTTNGRRAAGVLDLDME